MRWLLPIGLPGSIWWDRDVDDQGRPIRSDVRQAAHEIWPTWCVRVEATLGDLGDAAGLMESAVAHISRYLTRHGAPPFYPQAKSLLSLHFCQELKKKAGRLSRIRIVGLAADLDAVSTPSQQWIEESNFWHDFQKLHRQVDDRSWITFAMRHLGHDWPEVSEKLGIAISTAQNHFRNDFKQAWAKLNGGRASKAFSKRGRR